MTQEKLQEILEAHENWINGEPDGSFVDLSCVDLSGADLSCVNLINVNLCNANLCHADLSHANLCNADLGRANLCNADLSNANLSNADLSRANLHGADLSNANLSDANLSNANLSDANLSNAKNLLSAINFLDSHFERTKNGYIVYKTFGGMYAPPENWKIEPGNIIEEVVNPERQSDCGCGINVASLQWVKDNYKGEIWKCLIEWPWLAGVIVPFNTDGKIRCERVRLIEIVK